MQPSLIEKIPSLNKGPNVPTTSHNASLRDLSASLGHRSKNMKIWVEAYGCTANMGDSEMISGILKESGYQLGDNERGSSMNIIVTCSVKDVTEHKMLHRVGQLMKTGKPLIIAGCLPKANKKLLETRYPTASLLGPHSINRTIDVVKSTISGRRAVALEDSVSDKINLPKVRVNPVTSIIEIASGCMSGCTFCQTKLAKGQLRSYRIGDILRQFRHDVNDGCKEIWLSSTDNGCYGRDIGSNLIELLESCIRVNGDYKIRVGMMNPMFLTDMTEKLAELFAESDRIFKFLHIPVQSGSDNILREMKRGHTAKRFVDAVKTFRSKIPRMSIATDVIVGFPSENMDDFERTIDIIKATEPDIVNISKYSARPGTTAAKFKKLSSQIIKVRSKQMHLLSNNIALKRNALWKGWEGEIIIDQSNSRWLRGRNYAYKPVHIARSPGCQIQLGDRTRVKVQEFSSHMLIG
ncbi:MAG TPA: tRNA (N(6)-L-threonylcarbamoyladenosine(37)-C(2))-methylthiotransferase [Candidatus Nitrosopolaris sp.]|nr:tRNA (N(6)-L-threonylcarbamoyladenosine(37)-C(2))-methylthiotransferase [Candidatus Nitrosopolaris sp.]